MMPASLVGSLKQHIARTRAIHDLELSEGRGDVYLPDALARKYPKAPWEWAWQYVFPASSLSVTRAAARCAGIILTRSECNARSSAR